MTSSKESRVLSESPSCKHGFFAWSCRRRLCVSALAITTNTLFANVFISWILLVVALFFIVRTRPSLARMRLFLLVPLWPTLVVAVGFSVGFGSTVVASFGPVKICQEGLWLASAFLVRAYANILWISLVCVTSSVTEVLSTLSDLGFPRVLLDVIASMIRYGFLLFDEFGRMSVAARSRGAHGGFFARLKTYGCILAQVFLRAMDRAERIHLAQIARGKDENS